MRNQIFYAMLLASCALNGCGGKSMLQPPPQYAPQGMVAGFSSDDWRTVLSAVVTDDGYVRYDVLKKNAAVNDALMRYISLIGTVAPANRPDLFQTVPEQLAYWINAYNATCIYGVLLHNQTNPAALYNADFFRFGGVPLTLDQVEQQKIKPLNDPRVVFAINRATRSSPPLRAEPYDGLKLYTQLVDQGKRFLSDPRGAIREDDVAQVNKLLAVKYASDFLAAYQQRHGAPGTILLALHPYAAKHSAITQVQSIVPMGYDASLNRGS